MAAKKGFFQKADQKKQYSENVLNNVDSVYRPKNRARVKNPMSSNTLSGEEPGTLEGFDEQVSEMKQQSSRRNPVGYAFAGPQAKRQKMETQAKDSAKVMPTSDVTGETAPSAAVFAAPPGFGQPTQAAQPVREVNMEQAEYAEFVEIKLPEPEIQVRTGKASKKKTNVAIQKNKPKKSRQLSQPEIQVHTGLLSAKLSQTEIQVRTGMLNAGTPALKLSQPEIQVLTGSPAQKLSKPEIQARKGRLSKKPSLQAIQIPEEVFDEKQECEVQPENKVQPTTGLTINQEVAIELIQVAEVLEAMQALEADVQESQGRYEPVQESELQLARSLGFQSFFFNAPKKNELQYELDLNSIGDEFRQEQVEAENQPDAQNQISAQDEAILD